MRISVTTIAADRNNTPPLGQVSPAGGGVDGGVQASSSVPPLVPPTVMAEP